jgi:hypothetical protein
MIGVDTNIVVRLLSGDDPVQSKKAQEIFSREEKIKNLSGGYRPVGSGMGSPACLSFPTHQNPSLFSLPVWTPQLGPFLPGPNGKSP